MKNLFFCILTCFMANTLWAQNSSGGNSVSSVVSFIDFQKSLQRPSEAMSKNETALKKQFEEKKLAWPAKYVYLRSFKYDSQLEVWVKNDRKESYKLFKTYKVCALAGTLGPKRMEGDYQVPEGFYYINEFNPKSTYHLSLGINYPNISDRILSDINSPGGSIYIHGSCVTVGCIPLTDNYIDELYIISAHAKDQGQDFIPVHIFPVRFNVKKSVAYLENYMKDDPAMKKFAARLEEAFDYFDKYKQLPVIMINEDGEYIVDGIVAKKTEVEKIKRVPVQHRQRAIGKLNDAVHQWPLFEGGGDAFTKYLDSLGNEMVGFLPTGTRKVYVQVEFIVDQDGIPTNFKVLKGIKDEDFIDELITRLEKMPAWKPALLHDKPVAKKMVQTITVEVK